MKWMKILIVVIYFDYINNTSTASTAFTIIHMNFYVQMVLRKLAALSVSKIIRVGSQLAEIPFKNESQQLPNHPGQFVLIYGRSECRSLHAFTALTDYRLTLLLYYSVGNYLFWQRFWERSSFIYLLVKFVFLRQTCKNWKDATKKR